MAERLYCSESSERNPGWRSKLANRFTRYPGVWFLIVLEHEEPVFKRFVAFVKATHAVNRALQLRIFRRVQVPMPRNNVSKRPSVVAACLPVASVRQTGLRRFFPFIFEGPYRRQMTLSRGVYLSTQEFEVIRIVRHYDDSIRAD